MAKGKESASSRYLLAIGLKCVTHATSAVAAKSGVNEISSKASLYSTFYSDKKRDNVRILLPSAVLRPSLRSRLLSS